MSLPRSDDPWDSPSRPMTSELPETPVESAFVPDAPATRARVPAWGAPPAGLLFDLDGTLYDQPVLRRAMVGELARAGLRAPWRTLRAARHLARFRSVREELRELPEDAILDHEQYRIPAEPMGLEPDALRATVEEWMFRRPAPHLARAAWAGLRPTLLRLRAAGLPLGVFSDYRPTEKLVALGVDDLFDVALAATDPDVNAFKPSPRGFLAGAAALGLDPERVVYVGDRFDVDAVGAARAGMRCVILAASHEASAPPDSGTLPANLPPPRVVPRFEDLPDALDLDRA